MGTVSKQSTQPTWLLWRCLCDVHKSLRRSKKPPSEGDAATATAAAASATPVFDGPAQLHTRASATVADVDAQNSGADTRHGAPECAGSPRGVSATGAAAASQSLEGADRPPSAITAQGALGPAAAAAACTEWLLPAPSEEFSDGDAACIATIYRKCMALRRFVKAASVHSGDSGDGLPPALDAAAAQRMHCAVSEFVLREQRNGRAVILDGGVLALRPPAPPGKVFTAKQLMEEVEEASLIGALIAVYWDGDLKWYEGRCLAFDGSADGGVVTVRYSDGVEESLRLSENQVAWIGEGPSDDAEASSAANVDAHSAMHATQGDDVGTEAQEGVVRVRKEVSGSAALDSSSGLSEHRIGASRWAQMLEETFMLDQRITRLCSEVRVSPARPAAASQVRVSLAAVSTPCGIAPSRSCLPAILSNCGCLTACRTLAMHSCQWRWVLRPLALARRCRCAAR